MRWIALVALCALAACASNRAPNPEDPVDMAAELGNRGRAYVGMGELRDSATSSQYRGAILQMLSAEQERLGVLSGLVNRAHRGRATEALAAHMAAEMREHGYSAAEFCSEVTRQAETELSARTTQILALSGQGPDMRNLTRQTERALALDTPPDFYLRGDK